MGACVLGRKYSEAVIIYDKNTLKPIARVFIARTGRELVKVGFEAQGDVGFVREELGINGLESLRHSRQS